MWGETQDGVIVINLETGYCVRFTKLEGGKYAVIFDIKERLYVLGKYKSEEKAREMLDAFKQKLRRSGEKIFKFKEEAVENEVSC